ncbi:MAG: trigger factor [Chthoniobacterales bacterium]|nr:trigger factor [Chthoniobacterales bacterium]
MKITIEQKEPFLIDLYITLPPEAFEKAHQRIINQYQKEVIIPGFRKGKAPHSAIEKKYAREIEEEVFERLTDEALESALEQEQIDAFYQPILREQELHEDRSLHLVFTVTLRPKVNVEPSDYSGIEVEVEERLYASEEMADDFFEMARHEFANEILIKDRGLMMGDEALITYEWQTEREDLYEIANADSDFATYFAVDRYYSHSLDEEDEGNEFLPGLSSQLLGMRPEEIREIEITFPEDFYEERLGGLTIPYRVTLHEISIKELPPIDDLLAVQINPHNPHSTVEQLREEVMMDLQNKFDEAFEEEINEAIKAKLALNIPLNLPSPLIVKTERALITDFVRSCKEDELSEEELQSELGDFLPTVNKIAIKTLKWIVIAQAIEEKEAFEPTVEEFDECFHEIAKDRDLSPSELLEEIAKNNEFDSIYAQAAERKVLKFIRSQAQIIERPRAVEK